MMMSSGLKAVLAVAILLTIVGCERTGKFRMSEAEFKIAESDIAERELNQLMIIKYKRPRDFKVFDYLTTIKIRDTCSHFLNITRENIHISTDTSDFRRSKNYSLLDLNTVNLPAYQECITKNLYSIDIDNDTLHEIANSQSYLKFKDTPALNELLKRVKADGRVTLGEAEEIHMKIYILEKELEEERYNSAIESL